MLALLQYIPFSILPPTSGKKTSLTQTRFFIEKALFFQMLSNFCSIFHFRSSNTTARSEKELVTQLMVGFSLKKLIFQTLELFKKSYRHETNTSKYCKGPPGKCEYLSVFPFPNLQNSQEGEEGTKQFSLKKHQFFIQQRWLGIFRRYIKLLKVLKIE